MPYLHLSRPWSLVPVTVLEEMVLKRGRRSVIACVDSHRNKFIRATLTPPCCSWASITSSSLAKRREILAVDEAHDVRALPILMIFLRTQLDQGMWVVEMQLVPSHKPHISLSPRSGRTSPATLRIKLNLRPQRDDAYRHSS